MRILQICPRVPYPLYDGGAIGIFNITESLALRSHEIRMVAFGKEKTASFEKLRQYANLSVVEHRTDNRFFDALLMLRSELPYTVSKYYSDSMFRKLTEIVEHSPVDIVHVDHLHMAVYGVFLKERYGLPVVLREHNVEFATMQRFTQNQKNPILRWYARLQHKKLLRYEPQVCAKFDRCVMITPQDEHRMRSLSNRVRTTVIPAGFDLPAAAAAVSEKPKSILFLSSLDWRPNVDGFMWFYENVFPRILREEPEAVVTIVGKGRSPRLEQLDHPNLRFVGFVDDVVPYLQSAQVCIVPLFTGGGIRIKILEMFAHRKCVVSTSVGCEGIEAEHGRELLIADDAADFGRSLLQALRNQELCVLLGNNASKLIEHRYGWSQIGAAFEKVYRQCVEENKRQVANADQV